jgi:ParB/RepB/Spo0J family partition protein
MASRRKNIRGYVMTEVNNKKQSNKTTKKNTADAFSAAAVTNDSEKDNDRHNRRVSSALFRSDKPVIRPPRKIEQKILYELPVTKVTIEATLLKLDPRKTIVSKLNPRIQSLMHRTDPKLIEMKQSLFLNGQTDPIWARPIIIENEVWHEVFVGSTRRFLSLWITEETGELFPLSAWVADVPDIDASRMARVENNDRRDLSFWEKCIDAKRLSEEARASSLPIAAQAVELGISAGAFSEALRTVNIVPGKLIETLVSPNLLTNKSVRRMFKVLNNVDDFEKFTDYVKGILGEQKVDSISTLEIAMEAVATLPYELLDKIPNLKIFKGNDGKFIKAKLDAGMTIQYMLQHLANISEVTIDDLVDIVSGYDGKNKTKKPWTANINGKVKVKMTSHRSNKGQYKADFYNMSDSEIEKIQNFIESEFS